MTEDATRNSEDPNAERQYHLAVTPDEVAETVLLPGDPNRVDLITDLWDESREVARRREYRTATGEVEGAPVSVTSTGIGAPSAAIAVEELARAGADTFLRVGSCGALQPETSVGDLVITSGAVRGEGATTAYVREEYPATAHDEVVAALVAAAERLGHDYHVGVTATTDSFYAGQSRPAFGGYEPPDSEALLEELRRAGVQNVEMEAAAVLTLASIFGLRAGAVCTVYADRDTGEFAAEGQTAAAETASLAASVLARMDERKRKAGVDRWHSGLSVDLD